MSVSGFHARWNREKRSEFSPVGSSPDKLSDTERRSSASGVRATDLLAGTRGYDGVDIEDNSVIGRQPKSGASSTRKAEESLPGLGIGSETVIGTCVTVYAGTKIGESVMVADLAHIRQHCVIGDLALIGRAVTLSQQTTVGERSIIQTGCQLTADMIIEEDVFLGPEITESTVLFGGVAFLTPRGSFRRLWMLNRR